MRARVDARRCRGLLALGAFVVVSAWANVSPARAQMDLLASPESDGPDLIVLPFANHTGTYAAYESVLPELYRRLAEQGLHTVRHEQIRSTLREHRIRGRGRIGRSDAQILREEYGARFLLLGSIDIYQPNTSLEVAVSARVLDLNDLTLRAAWTFGSSVQQTERVFGTGRAEVIGDLLGPVLDSLTAALTDEMARGEASNPPDHTYDLVALVPLNDYSDRPYAAAIVQNVLLSELSAAGHPLVEPGFVHEILLDEREMARGGVSHPVQQLIREGTGARWFVTGEVETFELAPVAVENAVPRLEYGLRLIDATRSRLLASLDVNRDGLDGEHFFGRGREYSMIRICRSSMKEVVEWIEREGDSK